MAQLNKPGKRERDNPSSSYGAMQYFRQAQTDFKPPLISGDNAFLGDIASSEDKDDFSPMTCGFYRQEKGIPLIYHYAYHEMKIILDGHFWISDETGREVRATKGDVFYFPAGSKITFRTDDFGLAFYTGQRCRNTAATGCADTDSPKDDEEVKEISD